MSSRIDTRENGSIQVLNPTKYICQRERRGQLLQWLCDNRFITMVALTCQKTCYISEWHFTIVENQLSVTDMKCKKLLSNGHKIFDKLSACHFYEIVPIVLYGFSNFIFVWKLRKPLAIIFVVDVHRVLWSFKIFCTSPRPAVLVLGGWSVGGDVTIREFDGGVLKNTLDRSSRWPTATAPLLRKEPRLNVKKGNKFTVAQ